MEAERSSSDTDYGASPLFIEIQAALWCRRNHGLRHSTVQLFQISLPTKRQYTITMNMRNMKSALSRFLAISCLSAPAIGIDAVPADPELIYRELPDGGTLCVRITGDERSHVIFSEDGWPLVESDGRLWFATAGVSGKLEPSAYDAARRDAATEKWLSALDREELERRAMSRMESSMRKAGKRGNLPGLFDSRFPSTGEPHALVILVEFPDTKCSVKDPASYFDRMLNEEGFRLYGGTGSARDWFIEASSGKFRPTFDFYGPVTLPENMAFYGANDPETDSDIRPAHMALHACELLDDKIDFKKYDTNGDGLIDNVFLFYAGRGENEGGSDDTVWPHSWDLREAFPDEPKTFDGVQLAQYACTNEWRGDRPDGIGTFVHEFSHVLGLPDLYATRYSGAFTPGSWDVLAHGPYNNKSHTPPTYSSFARAALGWIEPEFIDRADNLELEDLRESNRAYMIQNPGNPDEYYLLENRQQSGWDKYMPGHGMLIWHVDYVKEVWDENEVNNKVGHQHVDLIEADGIQTDNSRAGDAFPGQMNVTDFRYGGRPSFRWWDDTDPRLPLSDISEDRYGIVSFKVAGGLPDSETPVALEAAEIGAYSFVARWNQVDNAVKYRLEVVYSDNGEALLTVDVPGSETSFPVSDLTPDTGFTYTVSAWQENKGMSRASNGVNVITGDATFEWYAPEARTPDFVADTKFKAVWEPLEGARDYFVTVYQKVDIETEQDIQDFTGGITCLGTGWSSTTEYLFENDDYSGDSQPSLRMNAGGTILQSCEYPTGIHSLSFWHRGTESADGNSIAVEAYVSGEWKLFAEVDVCIAEGGCSTILSGFDQGTRAIRISYKGSGSQRGPIGLDDVCVSREVSFNRDIVNGMEGISSCGETSLMIDNLQCETEYFYTIGATDGFLRSKESNPVRVLTLKDGESAIDIIRDSETGAAEYYNLLGMRIPANRTCGQIIIVRHGDKTEKICLK